MLEVLYDSNAHEHEEATKSSASDRLGVRGELITEVFAVSRCALKDSRLLSDGHCHSKEHAKQEQADCQIDVLSESDAR